VRDCTLEITDGHGNVEGGLEAKAPRQRLRVVVDQTVEVTMRADIAREEQQLMRKGKKGCFDILEETIT